MRIQENFKPQGFEVDQVPANLLEKMRSEYADLETAKRLPGVIKSGKLPAEVVKEAEAKLYKAIPLGGDVPKFPPFWFTKEELSRLLNSTTSFEQLSGLPLVSHAVQYEIYEIIAQTRATVFESTIANTVETGYTTVGTARQTLVLNRSK